MAEAKSSMVAYVVVRTYRLDSFEEKKRNIVPLVVGKMTKKLDYCTFFPISGDID